MMTLRPHSGLRPGDRLRWCWSRVRWMVVDDTGRELGYVEGTTVFVYL